jgi:hypothetical protein
MPGAAGGGAPGAAELRRLAAACGGAGAGAAGRAAAALRDALFDGGGDAHHVAAAVSAGVPRAIASLLQRGDVGDAPKEAALATACQLCGTAPGAEAFVAAGGLQGAAALLRSAAPAVHTMAVMALMGAAQSGAAAAELRLAAVAGVVPALAAMMEPVPAGSPDIVAARPYMAAALLCRLSAAALRATGGAPPTGRTAVADAIVRAGGVPLAVGVLRGVLEGGGGPAPPPLPPSELTLLCGLHDFCAGDAAALRAARGAGALPLAARALVATAGRGPSPVYVATYNTGLLFLYNLMTLSPADDLAALASQPALLAALAAALGLAARAAAGGAAAGGCALREVQNLAKTALCVLAALLPAGAAPARAAASSFVRAGGAAHLVRARAATNGWARCSRVVGCTSRAGGRSL